MIFFKFIRACNKYRFSFVLSTYGKVTLVLRPKNTFENINLEEKYLDYCSIYKLFSNAIKEMKEYRKERGF